MTPPEHPTHSDRPFVEEDGGDAAHAARLGREDLERVRGREPEALGLFFDTYFDRVFGLLLRLLGDESAARDAVQEVFLKVHRAADRLDAARDPAPWLATIATNVCRDYWRSSAGKMERRSSPIHEIEGLDRRLAHDGASPEELTLQAEREEMVRRALLALPESQREVVVLHDYEGHTHEEVAGIVGASHAAIRKRYSRALENLGKILEEWLR